jgi:antitoxin MazE
VLIPKKLVDKNQAYFWTKEWQDAEKAADEDIRAGRVKVFDSVEKLIEDLD